MALLPTKSPLPRLSNRGLLCDYRVVVLAINEDAVPGSKLVVPHGSNDTELDVGDAAKIIGCWRGLATHGEEA